SPRRRTTTTTMTMTTTTGTTMTTTEPSGAGHGKRPRLARETIVGWMVLVLFVSLASVVVIVHESLHLEVAERANDAVSQEIREFQTFTEEGIDPETGEPFTSSERLLDVFLDRQRLSRGEVIVGYVGTSGRVFYSPGPGTPEVDDGGYDVASDSAFLRAAAKDTSGTRDTPAGEMRWARSVVEVDGGESALLIAAQFTDEETARVDQTVQTLALISLAALVFGGVVSWLVAGRILRPVRQVQETAAEITEQDLTRRIDVRSE